MSNIVNGDSRKWLNQEELKQLFSAAESVRDEALFKLSYRHGLRCSEALSLRFNDIDFNNARIRIARIKNGISTTHPLTGKELRLLRRLQRSHGHEYLFPSRQRAVLSPRGVRNLFAKYSVLIDVKNLHHHRLRHSCGYWMARANINPTIIKEWLGHKNMTNTMIYVADAGQMFDTMQW